LRGELARFGIEDVADNHFRAFADEESGLGCALAAGAAGDQCDFFFKPVHVCVPPVCADERGGDASFRSSNSSEAYEMQGEGSSEWAASRRWTGCELWD
jgi:hypothetical protein